MVSFICKGVPQLEDTEKTELWLDALLENDGEGHFSSCTIAKQLFERRTTLEMRVSKMTGIQPRRRHTYLELHGQIPCGGSEMGRRALLTMPRDSLIAFKFWEDRGGRNILHIAVAEWNHHQSSELPQDPFLTNHVKRW